MRNFRAVAAQLRTDWSALAAAPARSAPWDLVLLDRDGTLNERIEDDYVRTPEQLRLKPEALAAMSVIARWGAPVALVTNQRGIGRGLLTWEQLDAIHGELLRELSARGVTLAAIAVCPHLAGECDCRKPAPGLIEAVLAAAPWARRDRTLLIGDMPSDAQAAHAAGVRGIIVESSSVDPWRAVLAGPQAGGPVSGTESARPGPPCG